MLERLFCRIIKLVVAIAKKYRQTVGMHPGAS